MAKKVSKSERLSKEQIEQLKAVGITRVKTVDDSMEKMSEKLAEMGVDVEDEDWGEVLEMCEALFADDISNDELADEVEEDDIDEIIEDEVESGDEDEVEEEVEEEKPVKKSSSKKKATSKPTKKEKPAAAEKKTKAKRTSGKRLNPKDNPEDAVRYDGFHKIVSKLGDFTLNFLTNGGCSVIHNGENSKKVLLSFDSPKLTDKGIIGRVYIPTLRDEDRLRELFGDDYEIKTSWSGNKLVTDFPLNELIQTFKDNSEEFKEVLGGLKKKDEKLGKNRAKMEQQLKESKDEKVAAVKSKSKAKKAIKAKEEPTPAKKASTKKASTKKKK